MRLLVWQLALIAVLSSALSGGCAHNLTRFPFGPGLPPRVPELDDDVINLEGIQRTSSQEDVKAILGEPPSVHELHGEGGTTWRYPIRHIGAVPLPTGAKAQRQVIPAVELKLWLDASGRVVTWGFFHPKTHSPMEIRESIKQVDAWFGKMRYPPRRIELAKVLKHGTSKEDVLKGMHLFEAMLVSKEVERSQARFSREGEREVLTYYADHPTTQHNNKGQVFCFDIFVVPR